MKPNLQQYGDIEIPFQFPSNWELLSVEEKTGGILGPQRRYLGTARDTNTGRVFSFRGTVRWVNSGRIWGTYSPDDTVTGQAVTETPRC